jgi:RNA polymerase sigma-70 factor (ECF subfamily)
MISTLTDDELMQKVRRGDTLAFAELYDRHGGRALRVARSLCREHAEEVVQESFLAIWGARASFEAAAGSSFRAWAMTIVRNRAIDSLRQNRRRFGDQPFEDHMADALAAPGPDAQAFAEREMERGLIFEGLDTLPLPQREAVVLAFFGGLSHGEIAQHLRLPPGTVKGRLRLGLSRLREAVEPQAVSA